MRSMSGKELAKLLEANGWNLLRIQGSHHIYGKVGNAARISIPIHRNQDLKIGLLRSLLKTAELLDSVEGKTTNLEPKSENQANQIDVELPVAIDLGENDTNNLK